MYKRQVASLQATLAAGESFNALADALPAMRARIENEAPADLLEPLKQLSSQFGDIEGASKIKSAVSKARSALKAKKPKPEKALKSIDTAIKEYDKQSQWRTAAAALTDGVSDYEQALKGTLGIRQQRRMTREQALFVARCNAEHRDISLNF